MLMTNLILILKVINFFTIAYVLPTCCICQNNDAVCSSPHQNPRQVLVSEKLPLPLLQGTDFVFAQMNLFPGANLYPVSVYTTLQKMFSPPVILGVFRTPSPTWPRCMTSSTSWCSTSGPVGSTSRRRSSESSGDTKYSSWMSCSLWPWIRSSSWMLTK